MARLSAIETTVSTTQYGTGIGRPGHIPDSNRGRGGLKRRKTEAHGTAEGLQKEINQLDGKLKQPDFVNKAPADVVEKNQSRLSEPSYSTQA